MDDLLADGSEVFTRRAMSPVDAAAASRHAQVATDGTLLWVPDLATLAAARAPEPTGMTVIGGTTFPTAHGQCYACGHQGGGFLIHVYQSTEVPFPEHDQECPECGSLRTGSCRPATR